MQLRMSSYAPSPAPEVSRQVWIPALRSRARHSARNSGWNSGSPPEKVTPPPERSLHRLATLRRLSIRIVAVEAPEGAALKKYHAAHAGTVHQAHAFHGMDISGQKGSLLF